MEVTRQSFESDLATILDSISSADFVAIDGEYTGIRDSLGQAKLLRHPRRALRQVPRRSAPERRAGIRPGRIPSGFSRRRRRLRQSVGGSRVQCPAVSGRVRAAGQGVRLHGGQPGVPEAPRPGPERVVDCGVYYLNEAQEAQLSASIECRRWLWRHRQSPVCCRPPPDPSAEVRIPVRRIGCVSSLGVRVALAARLQRPADGCQLLLRCEPPVGGNLGQTGDGYCRAEAAAADTIQPDGCVLWWCASVQDSTSARLLSAPQTMSAETESFALRCVGFSRVFRALVNLRKPLVGHNCFLDLLAIVDTKHLLYEFRSACKFNSLPIGSLRRRATPLNGFGPPARGLGADNQELGLAESSRPVAAAAAARGGGACVARRPGSLGPFHAGECSCACRHRTPQPEVALHCGFCGQQRQRRQSIRRPSFAAYRRVLESRAKLASTSSKAQAALRKAGRAPDPKSRRPSRFSCSQVGRGPIDLLWVGSDVDLGRPAAQPELRPARSSSPCRQFCWCSRSRQELADSEEFWLEPHRRLRTGPAYDWPYLANRHGTAGSTRAGPPLRCQDLQNAVL
uniref:Poly(A)-specific ribonuclease n=1 Tax=Macrostomum lignano TaxID=282301 RepID=A0A1I8FCA9_9PLAT